MTSRIAADPRIDPRIKALFGWPDQPPLPDVPDRATLLAEANSAEALAAEAALEPMFAACNSEENAPSFGLRITCEEIVSAPDGNRIRLSIMRPEGDRRVGCVFYLHGGGMQALSCFNGMYQGWGRIIAAQGLAVVMPDFRNAVRPSTAPELTPFPGGLNDCTSAFRWLLAHTDRLGIDPARIVIAGESGGGNLAIASTLALLREGEGDTVAGLYAFCPYIAGKWPHVAHPSTLENAGLLLDLNNNRGAIAYGVEAFERGDPLAWPSFATEADVREFPPTVVSVNECDPLRDEGIAFYRLLLRAGVAARCRQVMGTIHATEIFSIACPDISRDSAGDLARFVQTARTGG